MSVGDVAKQACIQLGKGNQQCLLFGFFLTCS